MKEGNSGGEEGITERKGHQGNLGLREKTQLGGGDLLAAHEPGRGTGNNQGELKVKVSP